MNKTIGKLFCLGVALVISGAGCITSPVVGEEQYHFRDGALMRGETPEVIRAVYIPGVFEPSMDETARWRAVHDAAAAGATTIAFDLWGFSATGDALPDTIVADLTTYMETLDGRRMGIICKLLGENTPDDPAWRLEAIRTAAAALRDLPDVLYWIDGPDSAALVRAFQADAPNLAIIAPEGAAIAAVEKGGGARRVGGQDIIVGDGPVSLDRGFILPATPENLAMLDAAMVLPSELQPWTPDNSILSQPERDEGFVSLFDGKSFNGWSMVGENKAGFGIENGAFVWLEPGGGWLQSRNRYDNFVLRLEWTIAEGGNSGIFLHAPRAARCSRIGMEFQLFGDNTVAPDPNSVGAIYDVVAPLVNAAKPAGEWNELEITFDGPRMKAILNGQLIHDVNFDENDELRRRLRTGFIGLQDHGHYVAWRNIRIKPLPGGG